MKKQLLLTGLIVSSSFALSTGAFADTTTAPGLPPEFSSLSTEALTTLSTLTGSARDAFLEANGITRPAGVESGSTTGKKVRTPRSGSGNTDTPKIELTDGEKTALESMTAEERDAFFASKGLRKPTDAGSGTLDGKKAPRNNTPRNALTNSGNTLGTNANITPGSRNERLEANKLKQKAQRIVKLQKKIEAGENLTRLEKKFARENDIEFTE